MSSGVQRTLSFSIHLRELGWEPIVLTANPSVYERTHPAQLADIPAHVTVARTRAFDAARHLAIRGRYWGRLALPDRWASWWLSAVPRGLHLIRQRRIEAIWSTYPHATAHMIGATLARLTGLPWIADFRDPMVEFVSETGQYYPTDPKLRRARLEIEATVSRRASRLVFCTSTALGIVKERYPRMDGGRLSVISNGYQEQSFADAETRSLHPGAPGRCVLLHSGIVYPGADRDPTALFVALHRLAQRGQVAPANFELRLRDPSNTSYFQRLASDHGIHGLVTIKPALPYREALAEMLSVEGLLLLQGQNSNPAIPAKLYEYLRAGRPIIALVHPAGETARLLRSVGIDTMASLTNADAIQQLLLEWITARSQMAARLPSRQVIAEYSRERLTAQMARVLDEAIESHDIEAMRVQRRSTRPAQ